MTELTKSDVEELKKPLKTPKPVKAAPVEAVDKPAPPHPVVHEVTPQDLMLDALETRVGQLEEDVELVWNICATLVGVTTDMKGQPPIAFLDRLRSELATVFNDKHKG